MTDDDEGQSPKRLYQMNENLEYRVAKLEEERLPNRVQTVEMIVGQLQGEVTAVKEIARSIGVKLDSGIQDLKTTNDARFMELKTENDKNKSFVKGVLWAAGALITIMQFGPFFMRIIEASVGAK